MSVEAHANVEIRTGADSSIQPATHFASVGSSVHVKLVLALLCDEMADVVGGQPKMGACASSDARAGFVAAGT